MPKIRKPRITIAGLLARIASLEELRQADKLAVEKWERAKSQAEQRNMTLGLEIEDLRKDRQWLRALIQNLVERQRNALPR